MLALSANIFSCLDLFSLFSLWNKNSWCFSGALTITVDVVAGVQIALASLLVGGNVVGVNLDR